MYNFTNFPSQIDASEYDKQMIAFTSFLEDVFVGSRFSLYQIGELGLLGVSDLDFLVIGASSAQEKKIKRNAKKYSLVDIPLFFSFESEIPVSYITHHSQFSYITGEKFLKEEDFHRPKELLALLSWKVLFFSGARNYYTSYFSKKISVKEALSQIHDLRYPYEYLSPFCSIDESVRSFFVDWFSFREHWFEHQDTEKLTSFLERAIEVHWKLLSYWQDVFSQSINVIDNKTNYLLGRYPTLFVSERNLGICRKLTEKYYQKYGFGDRFLVLPRSFDFRIWEGERLKFLQILKTRNVKFLPFSFINPFLELALSFKKIRDSFRITSFRNNEKA